MAVGVKTLRKKVSTIKKSVISLSKMLNKGVSKRCNCSGKCRRRKSSKRRKRSSKRKN